MSHREHCERCRTLSVTGLARRQGRSGRTSFFIPQSKPHYAPDLPFRLEHVVLDVTVDPEGKSLKGTATQKFRAVIAGRAWVKLDQIGLSIREARVGGQKAAFEIEGHALRVTLAQPPGVGEIIEVAIDYEVKDPKRGLYFTGPDADHPQKPYQVWAQGQDEDNHYWFPTLDYPNQKATSEVIANVPKGYVAVSNGALLTRKESSQGVRFHYKLGTPHVTYLITLAVGKFAEWEDQGPRGLPVQYFVAPGRESDGRRAFGNTPKMIEAFEKRIGEPYPYEKYSQVAVQDFIFGGMENTSATTQTDLTLHDERAHLDFSSDPLVSHELAHQWFGDLLTCRDWSHGWLNEGFATFMERIWVEEDQSPNGGWDEAKYYGYSDLKEYLRDDQTKYRRPIVCNSYVEPIDLFDTHLYHKGGLVLNLIRGLLGKDPFWKSIGLYVKRHRGGSVETIDLIRAIEDATGRNLRQFFDEWVFGAGYPELEVSYSWHDDRKQAEIVIEQKQTDGQAFKDENGARTHLFHLPINLELGLEGGNTVSQKIDLGNVRERVFIPVGLKPLRVRIDPDNWIPKTMKFPRPKELLLNQLEHDPDCMGRIEAVHELAKLLEPEVVPALLKAATSDKFWGVQAEACEALAEIRSDAAREALVQAVKMIAHPKSRRAAVRALGTYKDAKAAETLKKLAEKDPSYYVEADATWAFAESKLQPTKIPGAEVDEIEKFLHEQLGKQSYREVIRAGTLKGLALLPGIGRGERPRSLETLIQWTGRSNQNDARTAAVGALGFAGRHAVPSVRSRILEVFDTLADEPNFRVRMALIGACASLEHPDAVGVLEKVRSRDLDGRVKREALGVASALSTSGPAAESTATLKEQLSKLEEEYRKLRGMVEEARARSP